MTHSVSIPAVAYYRTSSATNVGDDKHSHTRQRDAIIEYASQPLTNTLTPRYTILSHYYDADVKGSDPITARPGFRDMLAYMQLHGIKHILIENASRFARDTVVQLTGYTLLRDMGITLIPVDCPDFFTEDTPTARMIRTILSAVSEFEKDSIVVKLRLARDAKRRATGRCEGRKPPCSVAAARARSLAVHVSAHTAPLQTLQTAHARPTLRAISHTLAAEGHLNAAGKPYSPAAVARMIGGAS